MSAFLNTMRVATLNFIVCTDYNDSKTNWIEWIELCASEGFY